MGITPTVARFLADSCRGRPLGRTATLGRQELLVGRQGLAAIARDLSFAADAASAAAGRYAEPFLRTMLGATEVVAIDFSDYEGAAIVHDLNRPLPGAFEQQFDAVIDGGTLEHVFNFPVALASAMRLLRPGGRLFIFTPANSLMGHGFYQFSPELLFRALSPAHGFDIECMQAVRSRYISTELAAVGRPLDVVDPFELGTRTVVAGHRPLTLQVRARKAVHLADPFAQPPQQSDYVQVWSGSSAVGAPSVTGLARFFHGVWLRLPGRVKWPLWNEYGRFYRNTLRNRRWFRRVR